MHNIVLVCVMERKHSNHQDSGSFIIIFSTIQLNSSYGTPRTGTGGSDRQPACSWWHHSGPLQCDREPKNAPFLTCQEAIWSFVFNFQNRFDFAVSLGVVLILFLFSSIFKAPLFEDYILEIPTTSFHAIRFEALNLHLPILDFPDIVVPRTTEFAKAVPSSQERRQYR